MTAGEYIRSPQTVELAQAVFQFVAMIVSYASLAALIWGLFTGKRWALLVGKGLLVLIGMAVVGLIVFSAFVLAVHGLGA